MTQHATSHHQLLLGGVDDLIAENKASASRSARLLEFFRRLEVAKPDDDGDPLALTARQETVVEVSELWAVPASWVRRQLNNALWTSTYFDRLWQLARSGQIDSYRANLIAETARAGLDTDEEYEALVRRLTPFLERHVRADGVVACTPKQLRNKLAYEIKVLRAADAEQRFRRAHEARDVRVGDGEHGISWLTVAGTTDQIALAAHRLTLNARALRAAGDDRTIEQIRADLAIDLLVGREAGQVPPYARPIINLTVPIQTVMGLADHPGRLSGGTVIPASLARTIAQSPGATWHRMLTDPAGRAVELSTTRYQPSRPIWEHVVAVQPTCFRPGCDHPATTSDLDHRVPYPEGRTAPSNLSPACRTDHRAKHAPGFSIQQTREGGFAFRTAAGFTHQIEDAEHPASSEWSDGSAAVQFSATEILDAVQLLRERRQQERPQRTDLYWEHDIRFEILGDVA